MYVANEDTKTTTLITYVAGGSTEYAAAKMLIAENIDLAIFPKKLKVRRLLTIDFTRRTGNEKNEAGLKRLQGILKVLEGHPTKVQMLYGNAVTYEEFLAKVG